MTKHPNVHCSLFDCHLSLFHEPVPSAHSIRMDSELIQGTHDDVIDHVIDRLGMVIEGGNRRRNDHSHTGEFQHIFQMDIVEWSFAHHQHQLTPFFENDVGRPVNEVVPLAVRDRRQRTHAAWRDDHPFGDERAARNRGTLIRISVRMPGERLHVVHRIRRLVQKRSYAPLAHDQMRLNACILHYLEQPHTENRARRPGDTDDYFHGRSIKFRAAASKRAPATAAAPIRRRSATDRCEKGLCPGNIHKNNPRAARWTDTQRFFQPTRTSKPFQRPKDRGRVISRSSSAKEPTCPAWRLRLQETGGRQSPSNRERPSSSKYSSAAAPSSRT